MTCYRFETLMTYSKKKFCRTIGIKTENFLCVVEKVKAYLESEYEFRPVKKRGKKSGLTLEDKIVLSIYYLRNYPTFSILGGYFGISESYANKIYN